ncbi:MAG: hypothetical protein QXX23_07355 [Thermoplasmata archaeon]
MTELVSNPAGAGGQTALNISRLGPKQAWVLHYLDGVGGQAPLYSHDNDEDGIIDNFPSTWSGYRERNALRVVFTLRRRGLVKVERVKCPLHPRFEKIYVFLTPEGSAALRALSEK